MLIRKLNKILTRPIAKIADKTYFATSVQSKSKEEKVVDTWVVTESKFEERYSHPLIDDHKPFSEADFNISLSVNPRPGLTLSADAYIDHVLDGKPFQNMADCFAQTAGSIGRFVSFDGSFAPQDKMAEFLACWVISTYATDVFDTVGYIWPNGERGSGKTQCLKTLMSLAFMGQTVTSSSTFATIRDEAALGATLGFDDCENISKMDPYKRELLLAGNTKGAGFMFKEPGKKEGQWTTKFIDTFAPRAFTSIGLPDEVLASRTILIQLMRTTDVEKTRRKPTNPKDWGGIDPAALRDAIWLNVATGLADIEALKDEVNASSDLAGRDFDIFQGPLAVAIWLERHHGVEGLFGRMQSVMDAYHATKQQNLLPSLEQIVLQAMWDQLEERRSEKATMATQTIVNGIANVLNRLDITDQELRAVDVQKVGRMLGRIGFKRSATHGKARSWAFTREEVLQRSRVAGISLDIMEPVAVEIDPEPMPAEKLYEAWMLTMESPVEEEIPF